jgi:putative ABC transport system substrate-binding protein
MRRRDFISVLAAEAAAAAWPLAARSQQRPAPVVGFLGPRAPDPVLLTNFHQGLNEWGYFQGRNVTVEYRWALDEQLPLGAAAAELARDRVALIVTAGGMATAKAASEASDSIPIVFIGVGLDPVENGFVASFSHPGGNATGLSVATTELLSKRLELLHQIVPKAARIGYLYNDDDAGLGAGGRSQISLDKRTAAELGLSVQCARDGRTIEAALGSMARQDIQALLVASDPLFSKQRELIVTLAARYGLPAGYTRREFADAGGLMSYGPSHTESWKEAGRYAGRILNGARPRDLPVKLQNKYELVINMKTARANGLTVPPLLHAIADEVIE